MLNEIIITIPKSLLLDIGFIIILATIFAFITKLIRQPLIPAYILTGIVLGPLGLGLISDSEVIISLSEIGIAFLLFIVGLEIDLRKLGSVSLISVFGGTFQVILTFLMGFFISLSLGFNNLVAIYMGLILAFSSTLVVIKLLSDKDRLDTLHGRIIIGFLLVQDLLVILALAVLNTLNNFSPEILFIALLKGVFLIIIGLFTRKYIFPIIFRFAAKTQELLFLSAIASCFIFAVLANILNFSIIIGAFIAGMSLASLPYNYEIIGKIMSLKDFFATIFFVSLGMQLVVIGKEMIFPLIIFLLVVILLKPLIVMITTSAFGYEKRTSFFTATSLGQVSEFSLIMATLAFYSLGHISQEFFSIIVVLTIITIITTSYIIKHDNNLYTLFGKYLVIFEKLAIGKKKFEYATKKDSKEIILFGLHRLGNIFYKTIKDKDKVLIVDHNPEVIEYLQENKIPCMYGDATNEEILDKVHLKKAKMIISTVPGLEDNGFLISYAKSVNPKLVIFVTASHIRSALDLYDIGADFVIVPHIFGGVKMAHLLKEIMIKPKRLKGIRNKSIKELLHYEMFWAE